MFKNEMQDQVDFLIVGASVAGSVLAEKFAQHGKVLFIDKHIPGTWMNCGGGMPEKVFKSFSVDIPYLPIKKAIMNINGKEHYFPCNYVVVNRSELDKSLYEKACKAGAVFKTMNFIGCDAGNQIAKFRVGSKEETVKYKKLILTHGFHPAKDPFTGEKRKCSAGVAIVEIVDSKSSYPDSFYFEIHGDFSQGYSWIFPMPDGRVNIGVGGIIRASVFSESLMDFKSLEDITGTVLRKGGGVLPLKPELKIQQGNISLFGDSAGMVNALNGEGLLHIDKFAEKYVNAVLSGKNLNLVWRTSSTFWFLFSAAFVSKILLSMGKILRIPLYAYSSCFVAFIRRMLGDLI
jgi:flavin-dependent dehydrogenase